MPKRPDCYKPACGVEGKLCPDCANFLPGASPLGILNSPSEGRRVSRRHLIDVTFNIAFQQMQPGWEARILVPDLDAFFKKVGEALPLEHKREGDTAEARLKGFPVVESRFMPPGCGMLQTPCYCPALEVMADGSQLTHLAKRHTVLIVYDATQANPPEEMPERPAGDGGGNVGPG